MGLLRVDFGLLALPNLKKSEVYKMLFEEEPQLRYMHQQQISTVTSEFSGKIRTTVIIISLDEFFWGEF